MALSAIAVLPLQAQEVIGSSAPEAPARPGWTFTPSFTFSDMYDDNVTLFGRGTTTDGANTDFIRSYAPAADLHYVGRHTTLRGSAAGSFLSYQNLSRLNRWDQRLRFEARRQQSTRLELFGYISRSVVPTTQAIDFGAVVYTNTGATLADGSSGLRYRLGARNEIETSVSFQSAAFDRAGDFGAFLRGGRAASSLTAYRHKLTERLSVGGDYEYRRAAVNGDADRAMTNSGQAAIDYRLSPAWTVSGGAGAIYVAASPVGAATTLPSLRLAIDRRDGKRRFHAGYLQAVVPSLGTGGTVRNKELGVGFTSQLFHSRHFYTDQSATFRSHTPLVRVPSELDLRSLYVSSVFGWAPQPWVNIEAFYSNVQQSTLLVGGRLDRNRVGFQIVTSKPVRMP
jgi:hypothetical protein